MENNNEGVDVLEFKVMDLFVTITVFLLFMVMVVSIVDYYQLFPRRLLVVFIVIVGYSFYRLLCKSFTVFIDDASGKLIKITKGNRELYPEDIRKITLNDYSKTVNVFYFRLYILELDGVLYFLDFKDTSDVQYKYMPMKERKEYNEKCAIRSKKIIDKFQKSLESLY